MWTDRTPPAAQHPPACQLAGVFWLSLPICWQANCYWKSVNWNLCVIKCFILKCFKCADKCVLVLYFSCAARCVTYRKSFHSLRDRFFRHTHAKTVITCNMYLPNAIQEVYLQPSLSSFTDLIFFFRITLTYDWGLLFGYSASSCYRCCYSFILHAIRILIDTCLVDSSIALMAVGSCKKNDWLEIRKVFVIIQPYFNLEM